MCHSLCLSRSGCLELGSPSHDPTPPAFWCLKASISYFLPCQCSQSSGPCLNRSSEWLLWNRSLTNNSTLCDQGTQEYLDSCTLDPGSQELIANDFTLLLLYHSFIIRPGQLQGSPQSPGSQNWLVIRISEVVKNTNHHPTVQDWSNYVLYHPKN